jgi:hypothetical protein
MTTLAFQEFVGGELVKMVEQKWLGRVVTGFGDAIEASFETDQVLRPVNTRSEIERRFRICIKWFITMRRDLEWSVPRILDTLPLALRCELDGERFEPDEIHAAWLKASNVHLESDGSPDMAPGTPFVSGIEAEGV